VAIHSRNVIGSYKMEIKNAKYVKNILDAIIYIEAEIDGVLTSVPIDPNNVDYAEIMKRKDEGTLTIKDAD
tara:strand:- start:315 stop:527 length:213 start_codon:yes stop_codon:yes gene_type:complete